MQTVYHLPYRCSVKQVEARKSLKNRFEVNASVWLLHFFLSAFELLCLGRIDQDPDPSKGSKFYIRRKEGDPDLEIFLIRIHNVVNSNKINGSKHFFECLEW